MLSWKSWCRPVVEPSTLFPSQRFICCGTNVSSSFGLTGKSSMSSDTACGAYCIHVNSKAPKID